MVSVDFDVDEFEVAIPFGVGIGGLEEFDAEMVEVATDNEKLKPRTHKNSRI